MVDEGLAKIKITRAEYDEIHSTSNKVRELGQSFMANQSHLAALTTNRDAFASVQNDMLDGSLAKSDVGFHNNLWDDQHSRTQSKQELSTARLKEQLKTERQKQGAFRKRGVSVKKQSDGFNKTQSSIMTSSGIDYS